MRVGGVDGDGWVEKMKGWGGVEMGGSGVKKMRVWGKVRWGGVEWGRVGGG